MDGHRHLIVSPIYCRLDDLLSIHIVELKPYEIVEIRAEMNDNYGDHWSSAVLLQADRTGKIDLSRDAPLLGSYDHACAMGLIWSMKKDVTNATKTRTPLAPIKTEFSLIREGAVFETLVVTRYLIDPHLIRKEINASGLIGTFYAHDDTTKRPTLIVLGGSEGGLREGQAALLAARGFNTLALAYFGVSGLPKQLVNIPLEYFEKAFAWLADQPNVDAQRLGIVGSSKGGELALLLGSRYRTLRAVVAVAPSSCVHHGLGETSDGAIPSSWSYKGESLVFAWNEEEQKREAQKLMDERTADGTMHYRDWYRVHADGADPQAMIPVEQSQAAILVVSGQDDKLWPSDRFGEQVVHRLSRSKYPYRFDHLTFKHAGHAIGYPGMPTTESTAVPYGTGFLATGGSPQANYEAQKKAWEHIILFLKESL
ncbi:acyl-CoA thioester hydrolase/BAAT C-terminal domain-containing protein [Camelliibacillus cellulosilyticus]|uniref:Acyl-CoA thioester hydrolase/BAAT C-terminal domain-containing protein n=1 Tax=Camelliibacillus cellulosilyticus TaxID=2174486 RepID=A0ABV9GJH5_9BACL